MNTDTDAAEKQIEGIPASDSNGLYGGSDNSDDSGIIRYIQIRHGGTLLGDDNEINGLTLGVLVQVQLLNMLKLSEM